MDRVDRNQRCREADHRSYSGQRTFRTLAGDEVNPPRRNGGFVRDTASLDLPVTDLTFKSAAEPSTWCERVRDPCQ